MTRPYRRAHTPERVAAILREEAGGHLDTDVVETWLRLAPGYHQELGAQASG